MAEDYAPFNINVTTVNPGSFNNQQALHVAIGGSYTDWYANQTTGISSPGSFTDAMPNVVYVFSASIRAVAGLPDNDGRPLQVIPAVATTISHEAGHAFGLRHYLGYNPAVASIGYSAGGADWTPMMGDNLASDRTKWWYGTNDLRIFQNDVAQIASLPINGFGYRPQDHGQTWYSADSLGVRTSNSSYTWLQNKGVIATTGEGDYFTFTTSGGQTDVSVNVASEGPNLDAKVELYRLNYYYNYPYLSKVSEADPGTSLDASLSQYLGSGTYYVVVKSHGTYGDLGQYTVNVTKWSPYAINWTAPLLTSQSPTLATTTTVQTRTDSSGSLWGGWGNYPGMVYDTATVSSQATRGSASGGSTLQSASSIDEAILRFVSDSRRDGAGDGLRRVEWGLPSLHVRQA